MNSTNHDRYKNYFDGPDQFLDSIRSLLDLRILKHPYLQRLKNISFLGVLQYIYPFSVTPRMRRYEHTLSVAHLTLQLCNRMGLNEEEKIIAVLTSLLHDIGHGPYSHSVEAYLTTWTGYKINHEKQILLNKFESFVDYSYKFLPGKLTTNYSRSALSKVLFKTFRGESPFNNIRNIFRYPFAPDNIDGTHRALYLLHPFIGNPNYEIDFTELFNEVCQLYTEEPKASHSLRSEYTKLDDCYNLERMLFARVFYETSTTVAAEAMLSRAMELRYPIGKPMPYQELNDITLNQQLHINEKSSKLWQKIKSNQLFAPLSLSDATLSNLWLTEYSSTQRPGQSFYATKKNFEFQLAKQLKVDPDDVIFHSYYPYTWHDDYRVYLQNYEQLDLFQGIATRGAPQREVPRKMVTIIYLPHNN